MPDRTTVMLPWSSIVMLVPEGGRLGRWPGKASQLVERPLRLEETREWVMKLTEGWSTYAPATNSDVFGTDGVRGAGTGERTRLYLLPRSMF